MQLTETEAMLIGIATGIVFYWILMSAAFRLGIPGQISGGATGVLLVVVALTPGIFLAALLVESLLHPFVFYP